jgi:hypothetical protein
MDRHITPEGETTIDSAIVNQDIDKETQLQTAIARFNDTIESHSHEFPRAQRYAIVALSEGNRIIAQQTFRVKPPSETLDHGESDPPNTAGIIGLQLRSSEAMMRMMLTSIAAQTEQQSRMVQAAYDRIAKLEEQRMADFDMREKLMGQQHERDLEVFIATSAEERKDRLFKRAEGVLAPLLPGIMQKMKILPPADKSKGASSPKLMRAFMESLSDEQQDAIFKTLKPEQAAMVLSLMPDDTDDEPKPTTKEES